MKLALVFPGQGSQSVGMGREVALADPKVMQVFDRANEVLGRDLKQIIFEGPAEVLQDTANTQPALYVTSLALWKALEGWNLKPAFFAGHSLGEYSALAAAGAFSFEQGLKLVDARAKAMAQQAAQTKGTMAAILGLEDAVVRQICAEASATAMVEAANFNSPGQVVVSGTVEGVAKAMELAGKKGALKCVPLSVSGAFHSSLMKPAGEALRPALAAAVWSPLSAPLVANVTAEPATDATVLMAALVAQVSQPVLWTASVEKMLAQGVDTFLEVGPGRVLSGLVKKVSKTVSLNNVEDLKSLEKSRASLQAAV